MSSDKTAGPDNGELARVLGLPAALAIGTGTMIGAGIFVFPGLAASQAGPAAILSFALGGLIALVVAANTAELATAMPASGGACHFVSRIFGRFPGFLVGIGQAAGLIFATAFYLVAFGRYLDDLLGDFGWGTGLPVVVLALGAGILLTLVNLFGTSDTGGLQNIVVGLLTVILIGLFGLGISRIAGGASELPATFAPEGTLPILTTTALIFTSYLGFVQIATVAGEIRDPSRNLPRALMGSVLLVILLYILGVVVTTSLIRPSLLETLGETAMVEVGRKLLGVVGGWLVLSLGLLSTISSANASILASSRSLYALAIDGTLPEWIARVHKRFHTPHLALLAVGIPLLGLVFIQRLDLLAQAASVLHLMIYTLICACIWRTRTHPQADYSPEFRLPRGRVLAAGGVLATLALQAFMDPLALAIGAGVILASGAGYSLLLRTNRP